MFQWLVVAEFHVAELHIAVAHVRGISFVQENGVQMLLWPVSLVQPQGYEEPVRDVLAVCQLLVPHARGAGAGPKTAVRTRMWEGHVFVYPKGVDTIYEYISIEKKAYLTFS